MRKLLLLSAALWLAAWSTATAPPPTAPPTAPPPPTAVPTKVPPTSVDTVAAPTAGPTSISPSPTSPSAPGATPTDTPLPPTPTPSRTPTATAAPLFAAVTYQDFEILPAALTIKVGTTVIFRIRSASGAFHQPYTPGFQNPGPNDFEAPANMGEGAQFSFQFNQAGSVTLLCGYHGNMLAALTVTP